MLGSAALFRGRLSNYPRARLCFACCDRWWRTTEEFGQPPEVLCHCGQQDFIFSAAQTSQSKPIEFENALHMGKPHLDLLALPAGQLEGFRSGQGADAVTDLFINIAGYFAYDCGGALWLQQTA